MEILKAEDMNITKMFMAIRELQYEVKSLKQANSDLYTYIENRDGELLQESREQLGLPSHDFVTGKSLYTGTADLDTFEENWRKNIKFKDFNPFKEMSEN